MKTSDGFAPGWLYSDGVTFYKAALLLGFLSAGLYGQTLDCGKYPVVSTQQGPACHRSGVLPWFAAIPGQWETELRLGTSGDTVRFNFITSPSNSFYDFNLLVEDTTWGSRTLESIMGIPTSKYASNWTRILAGCHYRAGQCEAEATSGAVLVSVDGPSVAAVEAATGYETIKFTSGGVVLSQAASPVLFLDQASSRWSAVILETPGSQQSQPGATVTSFAVMNLSTVAQAVQVRVYDERGNVAASGTTPVLDAGVAWPNVNDAPVGGIYSETLAKFLGAELRPSGCGIAPSSPACTGAPAFRGTLVLEGDKGGKIAPVVFRMAGLALATVPVKPE